MKVIGIDTNERVIDTIKSGSIHIEEAGFGRAFVHEELFRNGMLVATTTPGTGGTYLVIAVPTPIDDDKRPDLPERIRGRVKHRKLIGARKHRHH